MQTQCFICALCDIGILSVKFNRWVQVWQKQISLLALPKEHLVFAWSRLQCVWLNLIVCVNMLLIQGRKEWAFGIISCLWSHPAGLNVLTKSRANHMREATAESSFNSPVSESCWLLARQSKCAFYCECCRRLGEDSLHTGCVGGGTYVNAILRDGHTHPTDNVKNCAVTLLPPAEMQHGSVLWFWVSLWLHFSALVNLPQCDWNLI